MKCYVCGNCGEQAYDPEDVGLMQNVMRGLELEEAPPQIMNVQEVADLLRGICFCWDCWDARLGMHVMSAGGR